MNSTADSMSLVTHNDHLSRSKLAISNQSGTIPAMVGKTKPINGPPWSWLKDWVGFHRSYQNPSAYVLNVTKKSSPTTMEVTSAFLKPTLLALSSKMEYLSIGIAKIRTFNILYQSLGFQLNYSTALKQSIFIYKEKLLPRELRSPVHFFLLSSKGYHCANGRNDLFCYAPSCSIGILLSDCERCHNLGEDRAEKKERGKKR